MRKVLLILSILVIFVTSVSCLPAQKVSQKDLDQDTTISDMKTSIRTLDDKKASVDTVKTLQDSVNALNSKSTTPTDIYTKAQVDQAITSAVNNAISTLKTDQTWIKKNTSSTSTTSSTTNSDDDVLDSDGELVVTLDRTVEELYLPDNTWSEYIRVTVTNNGAATYYRLNADFDTDEDVQFATYPILSFSVDGNSNAYMYCNTASARTDDKAGTAWTQTVSNLSFTSRNSSGVTKLWIGKGKTESVFLRLFVDYNTSSLVREWDWSVSIKEVSN
jgi:hypothetical protein